MRAVGEEVEEFATEATERAVRPRRCGAFVDAQAFFRGMWALHGIATMAVAARSANGQVSLGAGRAGGRNVGGLPVVFRGNADWLKIPAVPTIEG